MQQEQERKHSKMDEDTKRIVEQFTALQVAAGELVAEIDALDKIAEMPYPNAKRLAKAVDVVRVLLGHRAKTA